MKKIRVLVRASFLEGLVLRSRVPIIIIEQLLIISVNYYIWRQVSSINLLDGYDTLKISTYPVIVWVLQLFINLSVFLRMMQQYRTGNIVIELIRPINYFQILFCSSIGKSLFKLVFGCIPTLIIVMMTTKLYVPHRYITVLVFCISILLSTILIAQIDYCLGRMVFLTENGNGLFMVRCLLIDIFSGILFPLEYAPIFLKQIISILPIRLIYYAPATIFLEIYSIEQSLYIVGQQICWIIIGVLFMKIVTKVTDAHLQVQGG